MNNTATRRLFEEKPAEDHQLAPVIPLKSVKRETKKVKPASVKADSKEKSAPGFTDAVFKPKKHDML